MGTLYDLAQEYRANQLPIERRLDELKAELVQTSSCERARKIRRRIDVLETMLAESRSTVHKLEHYYDKD